MTPITMQRTYSATLADVWAMWTTKDGIESWWGPDGFSVEVLTLDLRVGGTMRYAMTAMRAQEVAFVKNAGLKLRSEHRVVYREIEPLRRLAYVHDVDFVPHHAPYTMEYLVELHESAGRVRMALTFGRMHDEDWTSRAKVGWEMQLVKLERALEKQRGMA